VSGSVRFRPEQISAVTDSVLEQRQLDRVITIYNIMTGQFFSPSLLKKLKCWWSLYKDMIVVWWLFISSWDEVVHFVMVRLMIGLWLQSKFSE